MILGIDIGTTTISMAVYETGAEQAHAVFNIKNTAAIDPGREMRYLQSPAQIITTVLDVYRDVVGRYPIQKIGITGQMHGILYTNAQGAAVSPLYTWQDERGNLPFGSGTYLQSLNEIAGTSLSRGIAFGSLTHYYLTKTGQIPSGARKFCTIADYLAMRLTGTREPKMHVSNAGGMGLYNLKARAFDHGAIARAGMDVRFYPEIASGYQACGTTEKGACVSVAIGDNQASFFGSVRDWEGEILLNLGTGGQISCYSHEILEKEGVETRPLLDEDFITVYTSHCGGRAYAALENFYRQVLCMAGVSCESLYDAMEKAVLESGETADEVFVNPAFCGSRKNPGQRCEIANLTLENFTPAALSRGFMRGICMELYPFYESIRAKRTFSGITCAGNAIRKNRAFQAIVSEVFGLPLKLTKSAEEAAAGAVFFAQNTRG